MVSVSVFGVVEWKCLSEPHGEVTGIAKGQYNIKQPSAGQSVVWVRLGYFQQRSSLLILEPLHLPLSLIEGFKLLYFQYQLYKRHQRHQQLSFCWVVESGIISTAAWFLGKHADKMCFLFRQMGSLTFHFSHNFSSSTLGNFCTCIWSKLMHHLSAYFQFICWMYTIHSGNKFTTSYLVSGGTSNSQKPLHSSSNNFFRVACLYWYKCKVPASVCRYTMIYKLDILLITKIYVNLQWISNSF